MEKIQEDASSSTYSPNADDISLSSIVLRGFPSRSESPEDESTAASAENTLTTRGKAKSEPAIFKAGVRTAVAIACQASTKGILHSENTKGKSPKGRVSFRDEVKQEFSVQKERRQFSEIPRRYSEPAPVRRAIDDEEEKVDKKPAEDSIGVGVYMMVDRLRPGQCFVSITYYLNMLCNFSL